MTRREFIGSCAVAAANAAVPAAFAAKRGRGHDRESEGNFRFNCAGIDQIAEAMG